MPEKRSRVRSPAEIKRELKITERELHRVTDFQWIYAKLMLKFGLASWVFGLSVFFLVLVIRSPELLGEIPTAFPILIIAAAAPIAITGIATRRFGVKIKRLERARGLLLAEYGEAILKRTASLIKRK